MSSDKEKKLKKATNRKRKTKRLATELCICVQRQAEQWRASDVDFLKGRIALVGDVG